MSLEEKARELLRLAKGAGNPTGENPEAWRVDLTDEGCYFVKSGDDVVAKYSFARMDSPGQWRGVDRERARYIAAANPEAVSELARAHLEILKENEKLRKENNVAKVADNGFHSLLQACAAQLRAAGVDTLPLDEKASQLEDAIQKAGARHD